MSDQQTTQSKYQKKRKSEQQPQIEENEVRIKGNQGHVKRYVDYACRLLQGLPSNKPRTPMIEDKKKEDKKDDDKAAGGDDDANDEEKEESKPKQFDSIVLKATGRAINKAVTTAEVVKRRIGGLHQVTSLETLEITDVWEPTEAGLKEVETKRRVASITITLCRDESKVDKEAAGYQVPIAADAIKPVFNPNRRGFRRGYRGGFRRRGYGGYNRRGYNRNYRGRGGGGGYRGGYNRNYRGGGQQGGQGGGYNRNYGGRGGYNRNFGGFRGGGRNSPNRSPGRRGGFRGGGQRGGGGRRGGYNNQRRGGRNNQ